MRRRKAQLGFACTPCYQPHKNDLLSRRRRIMRKFAENMDRAGQTFRKLGKAAEQAGRAIGKHFGHLSRAAERTR